jgi:phytoene dehydrogenase-like protein
MTFHESLGRIGGVLGPLVSMTPPSIDDPSFGELWELFGVGRKFRGLPRRDAFRLLRWGRWRSRISSSEFFDTELLRRRSRRAGSSARSPARGRRARASGLIIQSAFDGNAAGPATFVRGGMGALTQAWPAAQGSARRIRTDAEVTRVSDAQRRRLGVVLATGEEIPRPAVVSNADPKRTLLGLIDPSTSIPTSSQKMRNYRAQGASPRSNLALSALPVFPSARRRRQRATLAGRIHIGPEIDYLERAFDAAKYGDFSPHPCCDVDDPDGHRSIAGARRASTSCP